MSFDVAKFLRMLFLVLLVGLLVLGAAYTFLDFGKPRQETDPITLAEQARDALEAVKIRQSTDRRPASYDSIMTPLDRMLALARQLTQDINYDSVNDYDNIRQLTEPVISIATEAQKQSETETGPLAKEYRFNQQKAEACQYLASAMWSRMEAQRSMNARGMFDAPQLYPEGEIAAVLGVINQGLDADPTNKELWYMRGIVNRANGLFAAAAKDLERSVEIDPGNAGAWNVLGLVNISLRQFDRAEESLERSKSIILARERIDGVRPGAEYTSIIFNLARFHEGLAAFYNRENRIDPSPENQRLAGRHRGEARKYFEEFLMREAPDSPDAATARRLMDGLGS